MARYLLVEMCYYAPSSGRRAGAALSLLAAPLSLQKRQRCPLEPLRATTPTQRTQPPED